MSSRVSNPAPHPLVERLQASNQEVEDVVALIGFVGLPRDGHVVLHPDVDYQRWLAIPDGEVVDTKPFDQYGRSVVWVTRSAMLQPVFNENVLTTLDGQFERGRMSTWQLIPGNLYVAAGMLDLLPRDERDRGRYA